MSEQKSDLRRALLYSLVIVAYLTSILATIGVFSLTGFYFRTQDLPVAIALMALFAISAFYPVVSRISLVAPSIKVVVPAAVALVLLLWCGTHTLFFNYPLTRDEHMVVFDAAMFGQGRLFMPLDPYWQEFATALVPAFLLDVPSHAILVSVYGPGNAMMRALLGMLVDPALMNPMLAGAGLIALYKVARRLFPENDGAVVVALLGYVLSAQVLVNAMTAYAMTPHLALNLIWLALFLEDRRWAHGLAMTIGAWAIGLHQVIFHPLFAGPLILTLLARRRWALFAAYSAVYAAALLFWAGYPTLLMKLANIQAATGSGAGLVGFFTNRVLSLLLDVNPVRLIFMLYNASRYIAWVPAFMLPLAIASWPAVRRNVGLALPLSAGVVLTLVMMMILLPYQGHGWGYRYLHPVMGNVMLLCGYGYARLAAGDIRRTNGFVLTSSAVTILVLPYLVFTASQFTRPYAELTDLVSRQVADFVVIDTETPSNAVDVVRNMPDLSNRPLVFSSKDLTQANFQELCRRGTIAFITRSDFHRVGLASDLPPSSPAFAWRRRLLAGQDCVVDTTN